MVTIDSQSSRSILSSSPLFLIGLLTACTAAVTDNVATIVGTLPSQVACSGNSGHALGEKYADPYPHDRHPWLPNDDGRNSQKGYNTLAGMRLLYLFEERGLAQEICLKSYEVDVSASRDGLVLSHDGTHRWVKYNKNNEEELVRKSLAKCVLYNHKGLDQHQPDPYKPNQQDPPECVLPATLRSFQEFGMEFLKLKPFQAAPVPLTVDLKWHLVRWKGSAPRFWAELVDTADQIERSKRVVRFLGHEKRTSEYQQFCDWMEGNLPANQRYGLDLYKDEGASAGTLCRRTKPLPRAVDAWFIAPSTLSASRGS